jgi:hypothetical protein
MSVETSSQFTQIIQEHLELKQRNSELEREMPIDRYLKEDTFENHPLFKTEQQARLEETMDGVDADVLAHGMPHVLQWQETKEPAGVSADPPSSSSEDPLWERSRDFDWGD